MTEEQDTQEELKNLTVGITFPTAEVLGRELQNEDEAEAFSYLANKFFTSEYVFEHLKAFIGIHFDTALKEVKSRIIVPSSNG